MKIKSVLMMATVAGAMILAGCSSDNDNIQGEDVSNTPITFITDVNSVQTRAGYASGTLAEDSFGLFLTTEGATDDDRFNVSNREMTYTDGAWTAPADASQLFWKNNTATVSYIAYVPYNAAALDGTAVHTAYPLSVSAEQTDANIKAADFLYVNGTTTGAVSGTSGIALAFNHKLTQFKLALTKGTAMDADVTFTSVKLSGCCGLATTINLTDGTVATTPTDAQTSTISMLKNSDAEFECILVPQTFTSTLKVKITASNGSVYCYISNETLPFNSGNTYTLPLTVGRDKVTLGTITATSWGTGNETSQLATN